MPTAELNFVVFSEDGVLVAQGVELDICVQAPDRPSLERRLDLTLQLDLQESLRRYGVPFAGILPATEHARARWLDSAGASSHRSVRTDDGARTTDYHLAMCA